MCPPRRSTLWTFKYAQPSPSSRNCGPPSTRLYSGVSYSSIPCYLIFIPKPQHTQKHTFLTPHQIESLSFVNPSFQTLQGTLLSKDHLLAQPLLNIFFTSTRRDYIFNLHPWYTPILTNLSTIHLPSPWHFE